MIAPFYLQQAWLAKKSLRPSGHTHYIWFIVVFPLHMFTNIEYITLYQFETNWAFLPTFIKKNGILINHEYLNTASTNEHEICRMHRMHRDVCTKKVSLLIIISWWLNKRSCLLTTNHTHFNTALQACKQNNFRTKNVSY